MKTSVLVGYIRANALRELSTRMHGSLEVLASLAHSEKQIYLMWFLEFSLIKFQKFTLFQFLVLAVEAISMISQFHEFFNVIFGSFFAIWPNCVAWHGVRVLTVSMNSYFSALHSVMMGLLCGENHRSSFLFVFTAMPSWGQILSFLPFSPQYIY
jgi:hypothetical protein